MLNEIIYYSLHSRLVTLACMLLLMIWGMYTMFNTDVDVLPDLNTPAIVVMTETNGIVPEEVGHLVTFPVEIAVNGAMNVRRMRFSSITGFSVVWIKFDWGTDIYQAHQIAPKELAVLGENLPENVDKPILGPQSFILGEMVILGLTADSTSPSDLRAVADRTIRPRLLSTSGVAQAAMIDGDIKEYQTLLDPACMKYYDVGLNEVSDVCRNMNRNADGGVLYEFSSEYIIRGVLSASKAEEIAQDVVEIMNEYPITLGDIATVKIGGKSPELETAFERAKPTVLITVTKQPDTNTEKLTEKLDKIAVDPQKSLPANVHVSTDVFHQNHFIDNSVNNVKKNLFEGSFFVVIVLFLFLMNIRTTVVSLVALPLSLLVSVIISYYMGLTISTISSGGMAIAIGSLVDDAIVGMKNMYKRIRENRPLSPDQQCFALEVVYDTSREIRISILNPTLIIMVSFVSLFSLSGMEGRMLVPLGIASIVVLFASTMVTPTLALVPCSYLLNRKATGMRELCKIWVTQKLRVIYKRALELALAYQKWMPGTTIASFMVTLVIFFHLGRSFLPPFNEGSFTINISSLPGISLDESDQIGRRAEALLLQVPEIKTVVRKINRVELDEHALGVNASKIEASFELRDCNRDKVMNGIRKKLSTINGANIGIEQPTSHHIDVMLSGTEAGTAIKLFGTDLNLAFTVNNQIKAAIQTIPGLVDSRIEQQIRRPQLVITPKCELLAKYGIPLPEFEEYISAMLGDEAVSQVYNDDKSLDLTVKTSDASRAVTDDISNLVIDAVGQKMPLSYMTDVRLVTGPNTISRENVQRKIVVSANVSERDLQSAVNEIRDRIEVNTRLPEGYHIEHGGQFESEAATNRTSSLMSSMSLLTTFMLLYNEFRDVKESGVILLNLPLALTDGVVILWPTSGEISIPATIGFISLFGIAARNGMLLISHYAHLWGEGIGLRESVVQGSLDRLDPIPMTALDSALALIPLTLSDGLPGNEIQSPMAAAISGGLSASTFLNGFITPIVYLIMNKNRE